MRLQLVHKLRYLMVVCQAELWHGNNITRKRFFERFLNHLISPHRLAQLSWLFFWLHSSVTMQRHNLRWFWCTNKLNNKEYLRSWLLPRYQIIPKIIVMGTGSVGDLLQITPIIRALKHRFPNAEICLLHRALAVNTVLKNNPYVTSISFADFHTLLRIKKVVKQKGYADLILEVPSVTYEVTYTRAPNSKLQIPKIYKPVKSAHYLETMAATSGLEINRYADLDFYLEPESVAITKLLQDKKNIITFQNGVDADVMRWGQATKQRPTKMLPIATWEKIVKFLTEQGLTVIQIGMPIDPLINGICHDLRGTTLQDAGNVIKRAICHIGTEGGLIHLARAVKTPSVVLFGPTSVSFLGYPQNINLTAGECLDCWQTTKNWFISCPRGLKESECMLAHKAEVIVEEVFKLRETYASTAAQHTRSIINTA